MKKKPKFTVKIRYKDGRFEVEDYEHLHEVIQRMQYINAVGYYYQVIHLEDY